MRTVDDLEVSYAQLEYPQLETERGIFHKLEQHKLLIVLITLAIAFAARVYRLDAASLAEDEANKLFAIRAYEQGDFTVNAEHPMVMKMLCYASLHTAAAWNNAVGDGAGLSITSEAAIRFPNALFGALTVIPLFLFTKVLLGFRVALITSMLWATGLDAIWFNRVGKEDTLLVFFMLTAFYVYNRAKQAPDSDATRQHRLYILAGAAFGLMIASKFFPHLFGLYVLFYHVVGYDSRNNRAKSGVIEMKFFAAMLLAFVAFNPAMFVPQTWRYLWKYVTENLMTHHGYLFMDELFINDISRTPGGAPWYYYFVFIWVKIPPPVIAAFLIGLIEIFRHRGRYPKSRGYLFLRIMLVFWLFPMALVGGKFLRYTLSLMPFLYMAAAVGIVVAWRALASLIRRASLDLQTARIAAAVAVAIVFIILPARTAFANLPYPNLYVNALGGRRTGYFFPHDEFYDLGARESIRYIAENAPRGARLASEIPGVVEYYLERYNRRDIKSEIMSKPDFSLNESAPDYVLLQRGRVYFENQQNLDFIEKNFPLEQASTFNGAAATEVYRIGSQ